MAFPNFLVVQIILCMNFLELYSLNIDFVARTKNEFYKIQKFVFISMQPKPTKSQLAKTT